VAAGAVDRFVCIHGHFYQPPRDHPGLGVVEQEESARPFHDWNERITNECYAPNTAARILDGRGRIARIVNNFERVSFNVGPTLMSWLDENRPDVSGAIVAADHVSRQRFGGHGNALAQAYNHMILPLASARDRRTQIRWGIRDFEQRFDRSPEGMWLPETAVDVPTLDDLATAGIAFTVLAPHQAHRVRALDASGAPAGDWRVVGERVDPTTPYLVRLPGRRSIVVFFYDGPISRAVAFEQLLDDGRRLSGRLLGALDGRAGPQLVHIATDGETYGHHHRYGDMALAAALEHLDGLADVHLTNYGEFLERFPPRHEAEIAEGTAWSCAHGIERWRSDCGCSSGAGPGWHQRWRAPLRAAFDHLRDAVAQPYADAAAELLADPWSARDDYVDLVLDRSTEAVDDFFGVHAKSDVAALDRVRALQLLELQRHLMLMYTSCGWFFDDVAGVEGTQVLRYAGQAVNLAEELGLGRGLEARLRDDLLAAEGNTAERPNGQVVYDTVIRPERVDAVRVAANFAVASLLTDGPAAASIRRVREWRSDRVDHHVMRAGRARLAVGRVRVTAVTTGEAAVITYGILHLGDHTLVGGARPHASLDSYGAMLEEVRAAFGRADVAGTIRALDRHFDRYPVSLMTLFRDVREAVVQEVLSSTLADAAAVHRALYDDQAPLMRFLTGIGVPLPATLRATAELVLTAELRAAFTALWVDEDEIRRVLDEASTLGIALPVETLAFAAREAVVDRAAALLEAPTDPGVLDRLAAAVAGAQLLPFPVDLWAAQNAVFALDGARSEVSPDLADALGLALDAETGAAVAGAETADA
jgi:alpha-amylase/alpha-mannosidase (GH57 family)